jgi:hypothetical protein
MLSVVAFKSLSEGCEVDVPGQKAYKPAAANRLKSRSFS